MKSAGKPHLTRPLREQLLDRQLHICTASFRASSGAPCRPIRGRIGECMVHTHAAYLTHIEIRH